MGEPYNKIDKNFEDIWTTNLNKDQFIDKLNNDIPYKNKYRNCCENIEKKKYQYIFINNKDEKLWNNLFFMFLNKDDFLNNKFFKISYNNNSPKLDPIF